LFAATIFSVLSYPEFRVERPRDPAVAPVPQNGVQPSNGSSNGASKIEAVFVLDTTGSMGGMIQAAKEKVWSIASSMTQAQPAPEIRLGLVAYRDRGDSYVTRVIDLSSDLDTLNASLMDFRADGGGDGPESVNRALYDAVHGISWSQDRNTYRVIFLIGDAPPHMDYQDEVGYVSTLALAEQRGIVVNTIQCGGDALTRNEWLRIAQLGRGQSFQVEQAGGAVALVTPFDRSLAELSSRLDATRLYYGDAGQQARQREKQQAAAKFNEQSSVESRARRATFNASPSGAVNLLGPQELIELKFPGNSHS
jgi:Mg-chelatase subunit ChlD